MDWIWKKIENSNDQSVKWIVFCFLLNNRDFIGFISAWTIPML